MNNDWIKTSAAKQAISFFSDSRPVWLYSEHGAKLLWCNPAAHLLNAKQKDNSVELAPLTHSLKTQLSHILKLVPVGRASLARLRFGNKDNQVFLTCNCKPLDLDDNEKALLIIGVDKIKKPLIKKYAMSQNVIKHLFAPDIGFIVFDNKKRPVAGSEYELKQFKNNEISKLSPNGSDVLEFNVGKKAFNLILWLNPKRKKQRKIIKGKSDSGQKPTKLRDLTSLVIKEREAEIEQAKKEIQEKLQKETQEENILWQVTGKGFEKDLEESHEKDNKISKHSKIPEQDNVEQAVAGQVGEGQSVAGIITKSEKISNYNFEELSRILLKKTAKDKQQSDVGVKKEGDFSNKIEKHNITSIIPKSPFVPKDRKTSSTSSLVNIPQETLILNRLPLGLVIFRDQQILFANREIMKLTGYEDLVSLRDAGLASLFPSSKPTQETSVGPITHLVKQNGMHVRVNARLQVITWQGKSSFLLSANKQEENIVNANNIEAAKLAVRDFASSFARIEESGFFITNRSAIITNVDEKSAKMLNRQTSDLVGRPLGEIIQPDNLVELRFFLERDAKSAQSEQPVVLLKTIDENIEILLFSEGRAGIVNSYFGIIKEVKISAKMHKKNFSGVEPEILENLSRSMRRPLNTIIGFSELISAPTFNLSNNERYDEYAKDIKTAGYELLSVIDDLETITKLNDAQYQPPQQDFDLTLLLEKCLFRTRSMASNEQVLIRSAISSKLGRIKADEASLEQAILNLIASAIEQTPRGEQVVISAQRQSNGAINIHIRDSGVNSEEDLSNFVVFRDEKNAAGVIKSPVVSSVGLSLTRSLLAINTCTLNIEPNISDGTTFSLQIPASLIYEVESK